MDPMSYLLPSSAYYLISPNMSEAGNIWIDGPTEQGTIIYSIVTPIICGFGIFGNFVSLVVMSRRELKGSVYVYLAVLAFVNLCSSILLFMSGLSCGILFLDEWPIYDALLLLPLAAIFNTMSVLTTIMVTTDRILYLANPLSRKKPKMCHSGSARKIMFACSIISILINIPYCFIFESDEYGQLKTRIIYYSGGYLVYNWIRFLLLGVVASALLTVGNGYLIYTLRKMKKMQAKCHQCIKSKKSKHFINLTIVLILIVFFFLINQIPSLLTNRATAGSFFFTPKDSDDPCNSKLLETVRQISTIINAISLSADFVLYYLFCPPFVKVLGKVLRRREHTKSVQMNVFVLDKQVCFDKNIKSIKELTAGKLFEMMDVESNRDSLPSSIYAGSEEGETAKNNRETVLTLCSNSAN